MNQHLSIPRRAILLGDTHFVTYILHPNGQVYAWNLYLSRLKKSLKESMLLPSWIDFCHYFEKELALVILKHPQRFLKIRMGVTVDHELDKSETRSLSSVMATPFLWATPMENPFELVKKATCLKISARGLDFKKYYQRKNLFYLLSQDLLAQHQKNDAEVNDLLWVDPQGQILETITSNVVGFLKGREFFLVHGQVVENENIPIYPGVMRELFYDFVSSRTLKNFIISPHHFRKSVTLEDLKNIKNIKIITTNSISLLHHGFLKKDEQINQDKVHENIDETHESGEIFLELKDQFINYLNTRLVYWSFLDEINHRS